MKPKQIIRTILIIFAVIISVVGYKIKRHNDVQEPIDPVQHAKNIERERNERATDTRIITLGGKKMTYNLYLSSSSLPGKHSYPNDTREQISYRVRINYDGSVVLWDRLFDPDPSKTNPPGIWAMVSLNGEMPNKDGKYLRFMYEEKMDNQYTYCRPAKDKLGLKRCIDELRSGSKGSRYQEYLVTMKDDVTPLRFLDVSIPRYLIGTGKGGGVRHHFMYDDKIQVEIYYRKQDLKNWKLIEESVINYINESIKEAENVKKIH